MILSRSRARFLHILADRVGGPHRLFVCERWASPGKRGTAARQRGTVYRNPFQRFGDFACGATVAPVSPCRSAFSTSSFFLPDRADGCSATDGHQPLVFPTPWT